MYKRSKKKRLLASIVVLIVLVAMVEPAFYLHF